MVDQDLGVADELGDGVGLAHELLQPVEPGAGIAVAHRLVGPGQLQGAHVEPGPDDRAQRGGEASGSMKRSPMTAISVACAGSGAEAREVGPDRRHGPAGGDIDGEEPGVAAGELRDRADQIAQERRRPTGRQAAAMSGNTPTATAAIIAAPAAPASWRELSRTGAPSTLARMVLQRLRAGGAAGDPDLLGHVAHGGVAVARGEGQALVDGADQVEEAVRVDSPVNWARRRRSTNGPRSPASWM